MNYLKLVIQKNKTLIIIYLTLGIFIAFFTNYSTAYYQKLIDNVTDQTLEYHTILFYGMILLLLCILDYLNEYPESKLKHEIFLTLKINALYKISKIDYDTYQKMGTGKLVQRIENGAAAGKSILFDFYFCLIREIIPSIVFSMIFIYQINQIVMYTLLAGYIFVFFITNLLLTSLYKLKEQLLFNEELMNHYLVRGFMELLVFRINKRFSHEIQKAAKVKEKIIESKVKMTLVHEAFFTIFALFIILIKVGIIVYGWYTKSITIGAIIALITLVDNAYTPIAIFNVLFVQYKLDKLSYKRYEKFLNSPEDNRLDTGITVSKLSGNIDFHSIAFSYENRKIFQQFSLKIKQGEKIALVGESGSGKSTFIKLLTGLLRPDAGEIRIDNFLLSDINLNSFYEHISYISQESPIFDGTLKENLVYDKEMEDTKIIEVLKKVHLFEFYSKLEKGLNTELGEKGITLSGGERQRLALARLWFESSEIVILDEATSAIDNLTEEVVMKEVMNYLASKTIILITHRLNSIQNFERIIALKNGTIIGQGTFDELLTKSAYFQTLYVSNSYRKH